MKIAPSLFLLLTTLPNHVNGDVRGRQEKSHDKKLVEQFKEHRKHKALLSTNQKETPSTASPGTHKKNGNLRTTPNGSNAAASRLSLAEMEKIVTEMKEKLAQDKSGKLTLRKKTKERYEAFISRYETLSAESAIQVIPKPDDVKAKQKLAWYTNNKHKQEFMETRGLVLGKTKEEREEVAEHIRMELADHEAGIKTMEEQLYEVKKNALARYDKVNHPKKGKGTKMERVKAKMEETKSLHTFGSQNDEDDTDADEKPDATDDSAPGEELAVSDGKTAEAIEPESLAAPPRTNVEDNDDDDTGKSTHGVIVRGEEVTRRHEDEVSKTREEKETYRKEQVGVKTSKRLHGDDDEKEENE